MNNNPNHCQYFIICSYLDILDIKCNVANNYIVHQFTLKSFIWQRHFVILPHKYKCTAEASTFQIHGLHWLKPVMHSPHVLVSEITLMAFDVIRSTEKYYDYIPSYVVCDSHITFWCVDSAYCTYDGHTGDA